MSAELNRNWVLTEEREGKGGYRIGILTLNAEKTLNALSLAMVDEAFEQLETWRRDERICCVVIRGAGDKALCAGGDIQALYRAMQSRSGPGAPCEHAEAFFTREYRLDYAIHQYPKPVLIWGNGVVMGGGLGVMAGGSHRVVTERTRIAMPEVTIGLYPDVGGSWFLNRMPGRTGLFLALTGASMNRADALYTGIGNYAVDHGNYDQVLECLAGTAWTGDLKTDGLLVDQCLVAWRTSEGTGEEDSRIASLRSVIDDVCGYDTVEEICAAIEALDSDDPWLTKARETMLAGSPLSVHLIYRQLERSRDMSLREVFQSELVLSTNIARYTEFAEGVRALLIDKDKNPAWNFPDVDSVPSDFVDSFFEPPWPDNPLDNL